MNPSDLGHLVYNEHEHLSSEQALPFEGLSSQSPTEHQVASKTTPDGSINPVDARQVLPPPSSPNMSQPDLVTYPEGGLGAYLVVLGSFSGMVASFGLMNSVGAFQAYLSTHQLSDHSPSAVGWIFGLYVFLTFFCGVQIGPVFDAKGPRMLVLGGTICLVAGLMGVASSTSTWVYLNEREI